MSCGGGWKFSQNVGFLDLTIWERQCLEDIFTKDDLISQLITIKHLFQDLSGNSNFSKSVFFCINFSLFEKFGLDIRISIIYKIISIHEY